MNRIPRDRVFISYAHEDQAKVRRLVAGLTQRKLNVWVDMENLGPGRWLPQIRKAISRSRYFILCISESALRKIGDEPGFQDNELNDAYSIAQTQSDTEFTIVPVRFEEGDRGDFRLSSFQQYDLFPDFEKGLNRLAVHLGGISLIDAAALDARTEDEKEIDRITGKIEAAIYAGDDNRALETLELIHERKRVDGAFNQIGEEYESRIKILEAKREQLLEVVSMLADKPKKEVIMGDVIKSKGQRGDITIVKNKAKVGVVKYINQEASDMVEKIAAAIQKSSGNDIEKEDAQEQLKKIEQELHKVEPDRGRLQRCWDYIARVIPEVAKVIPWKGLIEKVL